MSPHNSPKIVLPEASAQERRQPKPSGPEISDAQGSLLDIFLPFISRFKLDHLIYTGHHSADFVETRAEYITLRLRFMIVFYAIAIPLWIPVDYLTLTPDHFTDMVVSRLCLTAFLIPLGFFSWRKLTSTQVHVSLMLNVTAAGVFYAVSTLILSQGATENFTAGYSLMPFMIISMLSIFPLTLGWGFALTTTVIGIFLARVAAQGQLMTMETANALWVLCVLGGISLWVQSSQLLMLMRLYRESTQDPLTGMINRRVLMKRLAVEVDRVMQGGPSFCIMMFDLDRFKRINDNYGHLVGDTVLRTAASLFQKGLRKQDIVARFGGEEFVAVLPACLCAEAVTVAERIRQNCYDKKIYTPSGESVQLSTSVGVTEYEAGEKIEVTLNRVDESLYKAKEIGRNRVVHSQSANET